MIKSMEYRKNAQAFKKIFNLNLNEFVDTLLTTNHSAEFDYPKFDSVINKRHPELSGDDYSLRDIVNAYYGAKGVELIESFL